MERCALFSLTLARMFTTAYSDAKKTNNYWRDVQNCRTFFDEYAREHSFDPLDPENWYSMNLKQLLEKHVR